MKNTIQRWAFRLSITFSLLLGILIAIVLNPSILYAHETSYGQYQVLHQQPLDPSIFSRLDEATQLLQSSELYDPRFQMQVCLDRDATYPKIVEAIKGRAFGHGFANKVVLSSHCDFSANRAELNGYDWNLSQLIAHEAVHSLQFQELGIWRSNPIADIPIWKWEGYAEYISRQSTGLKLADAIAYYLANEDQPWMTMPDGSGTSPLYYRDWLLLHYCMDVKGMKYVQLLEEKISASETYREMLSLHEHLE